MGLKLILLSQSTEDARSNQNVAMEAFEYGTLLSILKDHDMEAFSRNVLQYKAMSGGAATSNHRQHIFGLHLMNLLIENHLSEFHAELELLSAEDLKSSFISFPIQLERQLMVGIYDEVLSTKLPHESYQFFVDHLLQTVRDSIADCMEVSYKDMSLGEAMKMMKFETVEELRTYIQEVRDDWIVDSGSDKLVFQASASASSGPPQQSSDIPSMKLISQSLTYATEMERIV